MANAYGFPVEGPWTEREPVPRVFVGYYQRFFYYSTPAGSFRYLAGEMSIPAPEGLSGGPVFRDDAPAMLTGMVTANNESYTTVDSFEKVVGIAETTHHEVSRVISYGVALMLSEVSDWLSEVVPPRSGMANIS